MFVKTHGRESHRRKSHGRKCRAVRVTAGEVVADVLRQAGPRISESVPMEIKHASAATVTDEGHAWRSEVGARSNSGRSVDRARALESGRGREADTPGQIPQRGWRDIFWRLVW